MIVFFFPSADELRVKLSELRFLGLKDFHDYFSRSADELRPKSGKTMVALSAGRA
jgi:hypothetical protein